MAFGCSSKLQLSGAPPPFAPAFPDCTASQVLPDAGSCPQ